MKSFCKLILFEAGLRAGSVDGLNRNKACSFGARNGSRVDRPLFRADRLYCFPGISKQVRDNDNNSASLGRIDVLNGAGLKARAKGARLRTASLAVPFSTSSKSHQYATPARTGILAKGKTLEAKASASRMVMRQRLGDWERIRSVHCVESDRPTDWQHTSNPAMGEVSPLPLSLPASISLKPCT